MLAACAPLRPGHPDSITVVTYNIQAGAGNLDRIAGELKLLDADIIALQEVDVRWHERSRFADQATELGRALGASARFAPIYQLPGSDDRPTREFGVALLTKHRIEAWTNDSLTRLSTQEDNPLPRRMPGLLRAVVSVRGQRLTVLTTHLDYRADPSVRRAQVGEILAMLDSVRGPVIVAGDLNATPDAPELQPLFARLRDAWLGAGEPGLTYPASAPTKRIDYILASRHLRRLGSRVGPAGAADHRPVIASFLVRRE